MERTLIEWDEEFDVVVIGSGFAGLAAAIEAASAGAKTLVVEKMKSFGGNSSISGGAFAVAGTDFQKKEGISDSPNLMLQDMVKAGLGLNHMELATLVAENSNQVLQWLQEDLGIELYHKPLVWFGGHSVPRSHCVKERKGYGIVKKELRKLKELGVPVRSKVFFSRFYRDDNGRIIGARFREGYRFPDPESGTVKNIRARKAVIMATGGFSRDLLLRTMQDPRLKEDIESNNHRGATAEGLLAMLDCGAAPIHLSHIQLLPLTSPDERGHGTAPRFCVRGFLYGPLVDPATGKRIVTEMGDRKMMADAIINTGHPCVLFAAREMMYDGGAVEERMPKALRRKVVREFNTIEELAAAYEIPVGPLKEEVERYNGFVIAGKDLDFGKPLVADARPLEKGPYLAVRLWPKVHYTMGGTMINTKAQVIDLHNKPIPGLYAAGEVVGGIHGACRLGSLATTECLIFGRIAGQNAARESA